VRALHRRLYIHAQLCRLKSAFDLVKAKFIVLIDVLIGGTYEEPVTDIGCSRTVLCPSNKTGLLSANSPAKTVTQHEKTIANESEIAAVQAKERRLIEIRERRLKSSWKGDDRSCFMFGLPAEL
jgi:hypothetical protein